MNAIPPRSSLTAATPPSKSVSKTASHPIDEQSDAEPGAKPSAEPGFDPTGRPKRNLPQQSLANRDVPFNSHQWALAHTDSNLFIGATSTQDVSEAQFSAFVKMLVDNVPFLTLCQDNKANRFKKADHLDWSSLVEYQRTAPLPENGQGSWRDMLEPVDLASDDEPASLAQCLSSAVPNNAGWRSVMRLETTAALFEGHCPTRLMTRAQNGELSKTSVVAGLVEADEFSEPEAVLSGWQKFRAKLSAYTALRRTKAPVPLNAADKEPQLETTPGPKPDQEPDPEPDQANAFNTVALSLDNAVLKQLAANQEVSRSTLLYALVLFHFQNKSQNKRNAGRFVFTSRPRTRLELDNGQLLTSRSNQMRVKPHADFSRFLEQLDRQLSKYNDGEMQSQYKAHCAQSFQRRMHNWSPKRFGPADPYDITKGMRLTMLAPMRDLNVVSALGIENIFAGTNTGSTPNCVFLPSRHRVALTFWASPEMQEKMPAFSAMLEKVGLDPEFLALPQQA